MKKGKYLKKTKKKKKQLREVTYKNYYSTAPKTFPFPFIYLFIYIFVGGGGGYHHTLLMCQVC